MHGPCMSNYTLVHKWRHEVFGFVIKESGMVGVQNETNRWMIYLFGKGVTIFWCTKQNRFKNLSFIDSQHIWDEGI